MTTSGFQLSNEALESWRRWNNIVPGSADKFVECVEAYGAMLLRTRPLTNTAPAGDRIGNIHTLVNLVGVRGYVFTHDTKPTNRPFSETLKNWAEASIRAIWRGEGSSADSYLALPQALRIDLTLAFKDKLSKEKWAEIAEATWRREVFELLFYRLIQIMTKIGPATDLALMLEFWNEGWPLMGIDDDNQLVIATAS